MTRKTVLGLAVAAIASAATLMGAPAPPPAMATDIKLATLAPANTSWHKALLDMGGAWAKDTENRVTLTDTAGGGQGDEATVIRKMRPGIETLQAALLTSGGLSDDIDAFNVFGIPFFFENDEEQLAVQKKLTPELEKRLQARGLHLLAWGTGGWVQVFSKKPLRTLADLKNAKLFTSKGDDKMYRWYVANGFHPVQLLPSEIPAELKKSTGLIDAAPNPPYLAATLQIFRDAKYMLDLHVAPLTAALVITNTAWNKLSPEDRAKVAAAAAAFETRGRAEAGPQDARSIQEMSTRGLEVIKLDPKAAAEFRTAAASLIATMRGNMVPADVFDMAIQERDAYRKSKGK
jgi:TRAP-type C4-dicarboxylate transport system substrate-binding protein